MKLSKCHFFSIEIQYLGHILSTKGINPLPLKTQAIQKMHPLTTPKQVHAFLGLVGYYRKFLKDFPKIAKPLTLLTQQQVKLESTPAHHEALLKLKGIHHTSTDSVIPQPKQEIYIVYTDTSDDACGAQLTQEHDGTEFPIVFLSHAFLETQRKWSTTEQEGYGVYYTITKWNYYLQGAGIIVRNDHKPLTKFLNGKNVNNKVNRWGLELATYNITFEWISRTKNKAADCLSCLVELPQTTPAPINLLSVTNSDGPTFNTRSQMCQHLSTDTVYSVPPDVMPDISTAPDPTPKLLMTDKLEALLQMQKTDSFCKRISR